MQGVPATVLPDKDTGKTVTEEKHNVAKDDAEAPPMPPTPDQDGPTEEHAAKCKALSLSLSLMLQTLWKGM